MSEQRMIPVDMSHESLIALLEDILEHVREGDSMEGHITWAFPLDDDAPPRTFGVQSTYRVGNLQGQGGTRMIGQWVDVPDEQP
jgi:hypothetical protein